MNRIASSCLWEPDELQSTGTGQLHQRTGTGWERPGAELVALTDLVMRKQHGLVEDCPFDRLVAGGGVQFGAIISS